MLRPPEMRFDRRAVLRSPVLVGAGLFLALIAGFAIGKTGQRDGTASARADPTGVPSHSHAGAGGPALPGTSVSAAGYTLAPSVTSFRAGVTQPFRFRIIRSTLRPVIDFTIAHEKRLHLIVARHDLSGYQHLHPAMAGDGTWSIPLTLPQPGIWRAYAEFVPGPAGKTPAPAAVTLAVDLTVPGDYQPIVLPAAAAQTSTDGFAVAYQGTPQDGTTQPVTMRVYSSGALVTDLQRYLGAYGHLVVLRDGDLAYLHVHPDDQLIGGAVRFWFAAPSPGRFRAFFEFQLAGHVHTAEFTIQVG